MTTGLPFISLTSVDAHSGVVCRRPDLGSKALHMLGRGGASLAANATANPEQRPFGLGLRQVPVAAKTLRLFREEDAKDTSTTEYVRLQLRTPRDNARAG